MKNYLNVSLINLCLHNFHHFLYSKFTWSHFVQVMTLIYYEYKHSQFHIILYMLYNAKKKLIWQVISISSMSGWTFYFWHEVFPPQKKNYSLCVFIDCCEPALDFFLWIHNFFIRDYFFFGNFLQFFFMTQSYDIMYEKMLKSKFGNCFSLLRWVEGDYDAFLEGVGSEEF